MIIPAYNEAECVEELTRRLGLLFDSMPDYVWRAIIVENGSRDDTWDRLVAAGERDQRIALVRLARNFRMDGGLTAGLEFADADAVVFMCADLQDPPEAIATFVSEWEGGYDNVYALVTERQGTGAVRRFNSQAFYWLAKSLSDGTIERNVSDFRLMDRRLYEAVRGMRESNRFMRGLVAWSGFPSKAVPVPRPPRFGGESKAYTWQVIGFGVRGIFAHSYKPLHFITIVGLLASLLAALALIFLVVRAFAYGVPFAGYGTIVALLLLIFGMLALMLGVIAEYISLIYEEVKGRPNYIVKDLVRLGNPAGHGISTP